MLRVVLADDENKILLLLQKLIDWKRLGYEIVGTAEHTETSERLMIYRALYGDCRLYARPLAMFLEKVDREKYPQIQQETRFVLEK